MPSFYFIAAKSGSHPYYAVNPEYFFHDRIFAFLGIFYE
jgi:hypothetical protein